MPVPMSKHLSFDDHIVKNGGHLVHKVIHRPQAVPAQPQVKNIVLRTPTPGTKPAETIILSHSGEVKSVGSHGTTQQIPLSKAEFEKVLSSLRLVKSSAQRQIHFNKPPEESSSSFTILGRSLLHSPDYEVAICNEMSPLPGSTFQSQALKRNIVELTVPSDKRIKLEMPTSSGGTDHVDLGLAWNESSSATPEVKVGMRRLNSMPVATSQAPSLHLMPQIIVRRVNRSQTAATMPTGEYINLHMNGTQAGGKCTPMLSDKTVAQLKSGPQTLLIDNPTPSGGTTSQLRTITSSLGNTLPIRIITNPSTSDPPSSQMSLTTLVEPFTPPTTPKNHPMFSTPLSGDGSQTSMHIIHQPGSLRKVLTATTASLPPSHNSASPFKVVIPSTAKQSNTTTYLLKIPSGKLAKTATM